MRQTLEGRSAEMKARLRDDLYPNERVDFDEFLDSFPDDIVVELVRQFGGWNSGQTYGQVKSVLRRMIEAWQAGQQRLREKIGEL